MSTMEYKGYTAQIEYDASANEFVGTTVDMKDVLFFSGTNVKELTRAFHKVVDAYLEWCENDGVEPEKPYQGKLSLRLPPELHRKVDIVATNRGTSINTYIQDALSAAVAEELGEPKSGRGSRRGAARRD